MEFETLTFDIDGVAHGGEGDRETGPPCWRCMAPPRSKGYDWARGLADRFRVYLPFHPGFGESDAAPHFTGMQDMIVHNLRLVAALGLDRPHLVGHSMGGWMAAEMAAVAGERFARLVLNAPAGLNHPDHPAADLAAIGPAGASGLPRAPRRRGAALFPRRLALPAARGVPRRSRQGRRGARSGSSRSMAWAIPISAAG